jgi:hypothetical protein
MSFSVRLTGIPGPDIEVSGVSVVPFVPEAAFQALQAQSGLSGLMQEWVGLVSRLPVGGAIPARLLHVPKIQASPTFIDLPLSWPELQAHWLFVVKLARLDVRIRPSLARLGIVPAELSGAGAVLGTGKAQAREDPVTSAVSPPSPMRPCLKKVAFSGTTTRAAFAPPRRLPARPPGLPPVKCAGRSPGVRPDSGRSILFQLWRSSWLSVVWRPGNPVPQTSWRG